MPNCEPIAVREDPQGSTDLIVKVAFARGAIREFGDRFLPAIEFTALDDDAGIGKRIEIPGVFEVQVREHERVHVLGSEPGLGQHRPCSAAGRPALVNVHEHLRRTICGIVALRKHALL